MREIKFRAWDKREGLQKMYYLIGFIKYGSGWFDGNSLYRGYEIHFGHSGYMKTIESEIEMMQFTGLKDKNGKEIYEGDIVLAEKLEFEGYYNDGNPDSPGEKYSDCKGRIFYEGAGFSFDGHSSGSIPLDAIDIKTVQVIGNIYQNTELIKQ